ncbi:MAG TPA: PPOX class F420-dependent oxidoreductase [Actinomycetes bacterium]|jgi:PPOX class probable F420-dependent enzyme|nr:PPOX class F420-dependent oxidoreductase [Actinomycetes bacterium]
MDEQVRAYLEPNHSAAMVTLRPDGRPHVARVGVALVDGRLLSSGIPGRVRTGHLRRDPRATLFVFDPANPLSWLGLEADVTILEGPDAPELSLRLFQEMQRGMSPAPTPGNLWWNGEEKNPEEFLRVMAEERRLVYEFEILRSYGRF